MKHLKFFLAPFLLTLIFCTQCNFKKAANRSSTKNQKIEYPKYAKNFFFSRNNNSVITGLSVLINKRQDTLTYPIVPKGSKEKINSTLSTIYIPIERIIATSTTDIPYIEALEKETTLVGFAETNYVSSQKTRKLINNGAIKDIGNTFQLNTETILELRPEIFISSSTTSKSKSLALLQRNAVPILTNTSWLETHPLGRAEWVKVFGLLFGKETEALQIFNRIESNYLRLQKIASTAKTQPRVLSGNLYKDVWYAPAGESFEAQLLKDANSDYLWKKSEGVGSLSLSIESILEKSKSADIWLGGGAFESIDKLTQFEEKYALLNPTKNNNVYTKDLTVGSTGGLLYFETGALRPDWILEDLIQILHPSLIEQTAFHFYKKLN